jgi:hypothetical protein
VAAIVQRAACDPDRARREVVVSCPSSDRLAAAASGEDEVALVHAEDCARCAAVLAEQADVVALSKRLPAPPLVGARTLAALVQAHVDVEPPRRTPWRWIAPVLLGAAAAAVVAIALRDRDSQLHAFDVSQLLPPPVVAPKPPDVVAPKPPDVVAPAPADIVATDAEYIRDHQRVQLRAGKLAIDTRGAKPLEVVSTGASVNVADANVEIVAAKGAIAMVHVFAGSAEVTASGHRVIVAAGDVWVPDPPVKRVAPPPVDSIEAPAPTGEAIDPTPVVPTSSVERSLAEFRTGWTALRGGFNADAVAAFDRATDPVVAEDALYWAAVASERAGDREGALRRYRAFVDRFASSPRVETARASIKRLAKI